MHRNKSRMPSHKLDQPYAIPRATRFGVGGDNGLRRFLDGGGKPKAALDPGQIVIDRLGNADDTDRQALPSDLSTQRRGTTQCPIATNSEEDADIVALEGRDHIAEFLRAARRAEERSPLLMDG